MTKEQTNKAVQIINFLTGRGFFTDVDLRRRAVMIKPTPDTALVERITANTDIIEGFLFSLDAPPATNHIFVVSDLFDAPDEYAMCVSCGVTWLCHGKPDAKNWARVADVSRVMLRACAPLPMPEPETIAA